MEFNRGTNPQLSEHFNGREFECPCGACTLQVVQPGLIEKLEALRVALGQPIRVTSGFRCQAHQASLRERGYPTAKGVSQHELGGAADLTCEPAHIERLKRLACDHFKAVGVAETWLHVDVRQDQTRRWEY